MRKKAVCEKAPGGGSGTHIMILLLPFNHPLPEKVSKEKVDNE
jgi:hypothetical protein